MFWPGFLVSFLPPPTCAHTVACTYLLCQPDTAHVFAPQQITARVKLQFCGGVRHSAASGPWASSLVTQLCVHPHVLPLVHNFQHHVPSTRAEPLSVRWGGGGVGAGEDPCFHSFLRAVSPAQPGPRAAAKEQSSAFLLLAGRLASSQSQSHSRLPIADHLTVFEVFVLILRLAGSFRFSLLRSVIGTWRTGPKTRPTVPAGRGSPVHQHGAYYRTGFR